MIISPALTSSTPQYAKRRESGASLSNVITGTPCATASSIAGVTARASETDSMTPSIRSFTACAIRCACTCPSSCGGVSHSIRIGRPSDADSSRARFSAPMRAATNDGLLALFAIIAMRSGRSAAVGAAGGAGLAPASLRSRQSAAAIAKKIPPKSTQRRTAPFSLQTAALQCSRHP